MSNKMHIKKGDIVAVIAGKDRRSGKDKKTGKVLAVFPKERKVIVEGVNMITKHTKPRRQGEVGGIIKQEAPIDASNVMLVCNRCGELTRVGRRVLENGDKARYCKKCGEMFND